MAPTRLSDADIQNLLAQLPKDGNATSLKSFNNDPAYEIPIHRTNVFIAGSGPIASAYAHTIINQHPTARVLMAEIGAQDSPIIGAHQKNAVKYVASFVLRILLIGHTDFKKILTRLVGQSFYSPTCTYHLQFILFREPFRPLRFPFQTPTNPLWRPLLGPQILTRSL